MDLMFNLAKSFISSTSP